MYGTKEGSGEVLDTGRVTGGYIPSSTEPLPLASDPRPSRVLLVGAILLVSSFSNKAYFLTHAV